MSKSAKTPDKKKNILDISTEDFESPVVFKTFKPPSNNTKNTTKRKKSKKTKDKNQLTLHQVYNDNFKYSDVNTEHLQLALALSRSTSEIYNCSTKEFPNTTSQMEGNKRTLLEFGFKSNRPKMEVDNKMIRREPPKINKKSKYRFVTPILMMRTEEERQSLIQSKLSALLLQNTDATFDHENSSAEVSSYELQKIICRNCSIFNLNRRILSSDEQFKVPQLNIEGTRTKCGSLLKDWKNIALRDHTPERNKIDFAVIPEFSTTKSSSEIFEKCTSTSTNESKNVSNEINCEQIQNSRLSVENEVENNCGAISPDLFETDTSFSENQTFTKSPNISVNAKKNLYNRILQEEETFEYNSIRNENHRSLTSESNNRIHDDKTVDRNNSQPAENNSQDFLQKGSSKVPDVDIIVLSSDEELSSLDNSFSESISKSKDLGKSTNIFSHEKTNNKIKKADFDELKCVSLKNKSFDSAKSKSSNSINVENQYGFDDEDMNILSNIKSINNEECSNRKSEGRLLSKKSRSTNELNLRRLSSFNGFDTKKEDSFKYNSPKSVNTLKKNGSLDNLRSKYFLEDKTKNQKYSYDNTSNSSSKCDELLQKDNTLERESNNVEFNYSKNSNLSVKEKDDVNEIFSSKLNKENTNQFNDSMKNEESKYEFCDESYKYLPKIPKSLQSRFSQNLDNLEEKYYDFEAYESNFGELDKDVSPSKDSNISDICENPNRIFSDTLSDSILNICHDEFLDHQNEEKDNTKISSTIFTTEINCKESASNNLTNTPDKNKKSKNTPTTPFRRYSSFNLNSTPISSTVFGRHKSDSNITPSGKFIMKTENITPMADYNSFSTPQIVQELGKFGLKPLKRKRGINLLKHIYESTHPKVEMKLKEAEEAPLVKRKKSDERQNENSDTCLYQEKNESRMFKRWSGTISESDAIFERRRSSKILTCQVPLQIVWHNFLNENPEILKNVLLYEPLQVEVIHKMIKELGYKFHLEDLISFFDKKCITIRLAQNGRNS